jgi:hypothetical protein
MRKVSPAKNPKLKVDGIQVEAGHFYMFQVTGQKLYTTPLPFCLIHSKEMKIY